MDMMAISNPRLSSKALEDLDLIESAVGGNQKAYAVLMERYRQSIYHTMLKMVNNRAEADDLTMEAFGKAFQKLPNYVPRYAFSTWLFKIAVNNCIDHVRKKRVPLSNVGDAYGNSDNHFDFLKFLSSHSETPEDEMIRQERISMVRKLLDRLPDKYRIMIKLRFDHERSYEEIAQVMNIPLGTVKAQLFRAKELLYQMLQSPYAKSYLERTTRHYRQAEMPGESL